LNLPVMLWGLGAPRATVGLAMYEASRSAGCAYCSAHACTFALRRGADPKDVSDGATSDRDRAATRVARALGAIPARITDEDRAELRRHVSPAHEEWIVLAIAMMGWLNKTMDGLGIPLEEDTVAEVRDLIGKSGWQPGVHLATMPDAVAPPKPDSFGKRFGVIRFAPKAVALDKQWTSGIPKRWPAIEQVLREETGHTWPVLGRLRHVRAQRAIAMMLRDNFRETIVGRAEKLSAGLVYAETIGSTSLADQLRACGATRVAGSPVQILARAVSPSPAVVDRDVVDRVRGMPPAAIVEVVTFIALLQLLHRLESYYA
jgi:alkylhydroperoxidase family enzyme